MHKLEKLKLLDSSGKYDVCGWSSRRKYSRDIVVNDLSGIYNATLQDGRRSALLKTLMTNRCENDCHYCANRSGRRIPREDFKPEELSAMFFDMYGGKIVDGLFLSSGVFPDPDTAMEQVLETARILRAKLMFRGYIHLKVMPGSSYEHVRQAVELADRVSINLEFPSRDGCSEVAPSKDYDIDIMKRIGWVRELIGRNSKKVSQTTQFIVGACEETDTDILRRVNQMYEEFDMKRCFFSAFAPVKQTPLEDKAAVPVAREHRLYQAEHLLRLYNFKLGELVFADAGNLRTDMDPKMAVALENRDMFPVDVNQASYEELLRVPGIGPKSASRVIGKGKERIESFTELYDLGVVVKRARPFLKFGNSVQRSIEDYEARAPGARSPTSEARSG